MTVLIIHKQPALLVLFIQVPIFGSSGVIMVKTLYKLRQFHNMKKYYAQQLHLNYIASVYKHFLQSTVLA